MSSLAERPIRAEPETIPWDDDEDPFPQVGGGNVASAAATPPTSNAGGVNAASDGAIPFDDDDFQLAPAEPKLATPLAEFADQFTFAVPCPLCQSRIDCLNTQVGSKTQCPDCHTEFVIPPPSAKQQRTPAAKNPVATGKKVDLAPAEERDERDLQAVKDQAAKLLAQARAEQEEIERRNATTYEDSTAVNLFRFFIQPEFISRLVLLVGGGAAALWLLRYSSGMFLGSPGSMGKVIGVPALGLTSFVVAAWLLALGAHCVALFRDSSYSNKEIEWPEFSPGEWFGVSLYIAVALLVSGLPGIVLGGALMSSVPFLVSYLVVVVSWLLLFPFVYLSMMNEVSITSVFSTRVAASFGEFRGPWFVFYQASGLLGLVLWGITLLTFGESAILAPVVSAGVVVLGLFYFRLLGWLASQIAPALSEAEEEEQEEQGK